DAIEVGEGGTGGGAVEPRLGLDQARQSVGAEREDRGELDGLAGRHGGRVDMPVEPGFEGRIDAAIAGVDRLWRAAKLGPCLPKPDADAMDGERNQLARQRRPEAVVPVADSGRRKVSAEPVGDDAHDEGLAVEDLELNAARQVLGVTRPAADMV